AGISAESAALGRRGGRGSGSTPGDRRSAEAGHPAGERPSPNRVPRGAGVKLDDRQTTASVDFDRGPTGAPADHAAVDSDPGRERRPLESYFQEIGGTRTLRREEEVYLAKELEASTKALRTALYLLPCSSRHVVERWDELRALSHTGAKLSESMGDEETGEIAARVERAVKRLRVLLADRDKLVKRRASLKTLEKLDHKIADELDKAQLSLALLSE